MPARSKGDNMPYSTLEDILEQLDEDTLVGLSDDQDTGQIDESVVNRAISDADAEIDSYCGSRYSVPLSPVPPIIRKISVDIAIYNLFSRRDAPPEERRNRYKDAVEFLKQVAMGRASLGQDDPDSTPAPAERPIITSSPKIFSRDSLKDW